MTATHGLIHLAELAARVRGAEAVDQP